MKKEYYLLIALLIVFVVALFLRFAQPYNLNAERVKQAIEANESSIDPDLFYSSQNDLELGLNELMKEIKNNASTDLEINSPQANDLVGSPLDIRGKVNGSLFFEGDIFIFLIDEDRELIASKQIYIDQKWDSDNFLEFNTQVDFETEAKQGQLVVFKKQDSTPDEPVKQINIPLFFK